MNSKQASPKRLNFSRNLPSFNEPDLLRVSADRLNLNITSKTSGIKLELSRATSLTASKASSAAECNGVTEFGFSNSEKKFKIKSL